MARRQTPRDCARSLWLLGLEPPVGHRELAAAWRERVALAHPDRHQDDASRSRAAETLTRALNGARETLEAWIDSGRDWPEPLGPPASPGQGEPPRPERRSRAAVRLTPCPETGLVSGDRVRVWPYDGAVELVDAVEPGARSAASWVRLADGTLVQARRVRLASFSCLVCGACAGPSTEEPALRPCPDCLVDLRRLEQDPGDADRIRKAIEARATAGLATARVVGDRRFEDRARSRRGWARLLAHAEADALERALLERFSSAYEAWAESVRAAA